MILSTLKATLKESHLFPQDRELLESFFDNYTQKEQEQFVSILEEDPHVWVKLLVRLKMVKEELAQGANDVITKQLEEATPFLELHG